MTQQQFDDWVADLEKRHFAELTFPEVSRALRALSSAYVERRSRLAEGAALAGAGKRAAFALFFGPLHYLVLRHIVSSLPNATTPVDTLIDLGCGTGASGAAWAVSCSKTPTVVGIDRHPWSVEEARKTYRGFGLSARVQVGDAARAGLPAQSAVLAAFTINELADAERSKLLQKLLQHARRGGRILIVEPLAGFVAPWWRDWQAAFESRGGRADEWRFRPELPGIVKKLDRAAGMNHSELTGRSLWLERALTQRRP